MVVLAVIGNVTVVVPFIVPETASVAVGIVNSEMLLIGHCEITSGKFGTSGTGGVVSVSSVDIFHIPRPKVPMYNMLSV